MKMVISRGRKERNGGIFGALERFSRRIAQSMARKSADEKRGRVK
jgi:hypothetical protein